jgi:hypothetical protein
VSLSITFNGAADGDDGPFHLASASEWKQFSQWALSLPVADFVSLHELAEEGATANSSQLSEQLDRALAQHPPALQGTVELAERVRELLGIGDAEETVSVHE